MAEALTDRLTTAGEPDRSQAINEMEPPQIVTRNTTAGMEMANITGCDDAARRLVPR